jgi:hypothetical protein
MVVGASLVVDLEGPAAIVLVAVVQSGDAETLEGECGRCTLLAVFAAHVFVIDVTSIPVDLEERGAVVLVAAVQRGNVKPQGGEAMAFTAKPLEFGNRIVWLTLACVILGAVVGSLTHKALTVFLI